MFSYIMLGANDLSRAITFYDPLMDILAYPRGGTDEGAPGLRPHFGEGFYSAYVRDPDGNKLGRTLLTFLVIDTSSYQATRALLQFTSRKEVEELHTVAGDGCVFIKVRVADTESLENFLMEIQSLEGVRSVRSYIALSTFLERGPSPD